MKHIKLIYHRFNEEGDIVTDVVVKVSGIEPLKDVIDYMDEAGHQMVKLDKYATSLARNDSFEKLKRTFQAKDIGLKAYDKAVKINNVNRTYGRKLESYENLNKKKVAIEEDIIKELNKIKGFYVNRRRQLDIDSPIISHPYGESEKAQNELRRLWRDQNENDYTSEMKRVLNKAYRNYGNTLNWGKIAYQTDLDILAKTGSKFDHNSSYYNLDARYRPYENGVMVGDLTKEFDNLKERTVDAAVEYVDKICNLIPSLVRYNYGDIRDFVRTMGIESDPTNAYSLVKSALNNSLDYIRDSNDLEVDKKYEEILADDLLYDKQTAAFKKMKHLDKNTRFKGGKTLKDVNYAADYDEILNAPTKKEYREIRKKQDEELKKLDERMLAEWDKHKNKPYAPKINDPYSFDGMMQVHNALRTMGVSDYYYQDSTDNTVEEELKSKEQRIKEEKKQRRLEEKQRKERNKKEMNEYKAKQKIIKSLPDTTDYDLDNYSLTKLQMLALQQKYDTNERFKKKLNKKGIPRNEEDMDIYGKKDFKEYAYTVMSELNKPADREEYRELLKKYKKDFGDQFVKNKLEGKKQSLSLDRPKDWFNNKGKYSDDWSMFETIPQNKFTTSVPIDIQRFGNKKLTETQKLQNELYKLIEKASNQNIVSDKSLSNMKALVTQAKNFNSAAGLGKDSNSIFETLTDRFGVSKPEAFQAMALSGNKLSSELKLDLDQIKELSKEFDKIEKAQEKEMAIQQDKLVSLYAVQGIAGEIAKASGENAKEIEEENLALQEQIDQRKTIKALVTTGVISEMANKQGARSRQYDQIKANFAETMYPTTDEAIRKEWIEREKVNRSLDSKIEKLKKELELQGQSGYTTDDPSAESNAIKEQMLANVTIFDKIKQSLLDIKNKSKDSFKSMGEDVEDVGDKIEQNLLDSFTKLFRTMYRVANYMVDFNVKQTAPYNAYAKYIESQNLFNTAFGKGMKEVNSELNDFSEEANEWANTISKALYLNPSELYQYSGALYSLVKGMGVAEEQAKTMAFNLTQLSYDMTSYLNLDSYETGFEKIRSAISGQSRAVGTAGVPIQMESLEELADSLGIEKSVSSMTQAEKTVMRYIALMKATGDIQMDLGKTINSPENALKSLQQSFEMVRISIGQLITPIISKLIPIFIALANIIQECAKKLADFFNIEIDSDYSRGSSEWSDIFNNISDDADDATDSINRSLAAFDDLNVVESDSSNGNGTGNSILQDLYQYITGYNMLEKLKTAFSEEISNAEKKIKSLIPWLIAGATAFGAFKIAASLGNAISWIAGVGNSVSKISGWFSKFKSAGDVKSEANSVKEAVKSADGVADSVNNSKFGTFSDFKSKAKQITEAIGLLGLVIVEFGALMLIIGELLKIQGVRAAIEEGIDICVDMFVGVLKMLPGLAGLTALSTVISKIGAKDMAIGFGELALVIAGTTVLVEAIGGLNGFFGADFLQSGIDTMVSIFEGVGKILIPLAGLTGLAALAGLGESVILPGLGILALIIVGSTAFVEAISMITQYFTEDILKNGVDSMVYIFEGIQKMLIPLAGLEGLAALAGLGESIIIPGLGILAAVILATTAIAEVIGAAVEIWGSTDLIQEGVDGMVVVFEGIGKMYGALMGGFGGQVAESFSKSLPEIGNNLSAFATNSKDFFDTIKDVSPTVAETADSMASAILKFTTATFVAGCQTFIGTKLSILKVGMVLEGFAGYIKKYASSIKGLDAEAVKASDAAVKAVLSYGDLAPKYSFFGMLFGQSSLYLYGRELELFGASIGRYAAVMEFVDPNIITKTDAAVKTVLAYADMAPKYGLLQMFLGTSSLSLFGTELELFGASLGRYCGFIGTLSTSDLDFMDEASDTIERILAWKVPTSGGLITWINDQTLGKFGTELEKFGSRFAGYYDSIKGVSNAKIDSISDFIQSLISSLQTWNGSNLKAALDSFSTSLSSLGTSLNSTFSQTFSESNGNTLGTNFGNAVGKKMKDAIKNKLGSTIDVKSGLSKLATYSITMYANGGMPNSGDLFWANENGAAEYITSIGNRTAVANQDQMIQAISGAITTAMGGQTQQRGNVVVYIGNDKVYEGQGTYQSRQSDRYGTTYVKI